MWRLLKNTGSNVALLIVKLAVTFVMTPIIVRALGNYDYGIWEMVVAVVGYMGLLDLGFKPTISRYAAKFNAENDARQLQVLLSTAMSFLGLVGGAALIAFALAAALFPHVLAPDDGSTGRYAVFLLIIGLQLFAAFLGNIAESMLEGLQLYYVKNNVTIFNSLTGAVITYAFIHRFDALIFLALLNGIGTTSKFMTFYLLLKRARGDSLRITTRFRSMAFLKETLGFSLKSFVQGLATSVESNAAPLIIGTVLGPAVVVFYALPAALAKQVRSLMWTLTHAFMPLFSDLHARGQRERLSSVYIAASRMVVGVIAPAMVLIVLIGPDFIARWVGPEYGARAVHLLPFVVCTFLLPGLNPFSSRYLTATGQHGYLAKIGPASAIVSIATSIALVHRFDIEGVAAGAMLPVLASTFLIARYVCAQLGVSVTRYFREAVGSILLPLGVMAAVAWQTERMLGASSYATMVAIAACSLGVYVLLALALAISRAERTAILARLSSWSIGAGRQA